MNSPLPIRILKAILTPLRMLYWWLQHERWRYLYFYGFFTKKIHVIEPEIWEEFRKRATVLAVPVDFYLRYLRTESDRAGECFERSYYMFFCLDDAVLVRGDVIGIASANGGWEESRHGWIEYNNTCYDPNDLLAYDKDFYYRLEKVRNVTYHTHGEEVAEQGNDGYGQFWFWRDDFKPGGSQRHLLPVALGIIETLRRTKPDTGFRYNFAKFLEDVEYSQDDAADTVPAYVRNHNILPTIPPEEDGEPTTRQAPPRALRFAKRRVTKVPPQAQTPQPQTQTVQPQTQAASPSA